MEKKIKIGDRVRLSGIDRIGTVTKIKGNQAKVSVIGESSQWRKIKDLKLENEL